MHKFYIRPISEIRRRRQKKSGVLFQFTVTAARWRPDLAYTACSTAYGLAEQINKKFFFIQLLLEFDDASNLIYTFILQCLKIFSYVDRTPLVCG